MSKQGTSNNVTKRVSKSAVLAGAALALPLASKADVVTTPANISVVSTGSDQSFSLDLNGDGINDFQFTASLNNATDTVTPLGSNGYVGTATNMPTPLGGGSVIGPGDTFQTGAGVLQTTPTPISGPPFEAGPGRQRHFSKRPMDLHTLASNSISTPHCTMDGSI